MKIEDVITEVIMAIYSCSRLEKKLILKGGSTLRMFYGQSTRLSIDADFSIKGVLKEADPVFREMKQSLTGRFSTLGFELIDFSADRRPKKVHKGFPDWWGGWVCEFKLVDRKHSTKTLKTRRRNALIPAGANSPKIKIDLSEHEYCGRPRTKIIRGVKIYAYSREILVLEKLRAICQQHPEYKYRQQTKNRARDFYDIYVLTTDFDDAFIRRCQGDLKAVFDAKEVPVRLLRTLWGDDAFIDDFRRGFNQVKDSVRGEVNEFDVYLEHIRFLILDIYPDVSAQLFR